ENGSCEILANRSAVAARKGECAEKLVTVRLQEGLTAIVVLCPPDVLEPSERRSVHRRVVDDRDVEGATLQPPGPRRSEERVGDPVPSQLIGPAEVHVDLRIEEGMETLVRIGRADTGLS